ncbi:MAG: ChbG/HpnK family deacetylase [Planctomycetia bacterium]|nr:ChbG/HpnK family deacetylase [Planctomycetia bacterium]
MENRKYSLIINGDDLGLSESVNQSLLWAADKGILSSLSLMVNMPEADQALIDLAEIRKENPEFRPGLGLHFCLTSGRALSDPADIPDLADTNGRFRCGFLSLLRGVHKKSFLDQIQREFSLQFERFLEYKGKYDLIMDHLDSHQHIHCIPGIFDLLRKTAEKYEIVLRITHEEFGSTARFFRSICKRIPGGIAKKIILDTLLWKSRCGLRRSGSDRVGYFGIIDTGKMDESSILAITRVIPKIARRSGIQAFEINLHPWDFDQTDLTGLDVSEDDRIFASSTWRKQEWNALMNPANILNSMEKEGIRLARFADLR